MLTPSQNQIAALMFLNGLLFLGLNFIACSIIFPGPPGSKRLGYVLIVSVGLAFAVMQEYRMLQALDFPPGTARSLLIGGFVIPVFLVSLVYYRIKKARLSKTVPPAPRGSSHDSDRSS